MSTAPKSSPAGPDRSRPVGAALAPANRGVRSVLALDLTACPECDQPAEVLARMVIGSTDGPIEHVRLRCLLRHVFLMPVALLPERAAS